MTERTAADDAVVIRLATDADVDELARLRYAMTAEEGNASEPAHEFVRRFRVAWGRTGATDRWSVWVAEAAGIVVGCLWIQRIDRVPRPNRDAVQMGYVTNVYVDADWRNHGIGSRLLAVAEAAARDSRMSELFVWPSERAGSLYRRAGYHPSTELHELELIPDE